MIRATLRNEAFKLRLSGGRMLGSVLPDCRELRIAALRNDTAAVQILVSADEAVSVCLTDAPHFSRVPGAYRLRLEAEGELETELFELGMLPDDDGSEAADILLPSDSFELADGTPRAVYCRFRVPAQTAPNEYEMRLTLYGSGLFEPETVLERFRVTVAVSGAALPERPAFRLDLWQHCSNIARHHDVPLWSDAHFAVLDSYLESLAALGQKSATVIASEIPWQGQNCYQYQNNPSNLFEYSMIRVERDAQGFQYDFSPMDRYLDLCEAHGTAEEIEVFGLVNVWINNKSGFTGPVAENPSGPRVRYYDRAGHIWRWMNRAEEVDDYIRAVAEHFRRTGRLARVRVASDEPTDPEQYAAGVSQIHGLEPEFRFKTAINHAEFIERFHDSIDVFAPFIYCVSREWDRMREYRERYPDKVFQWYLCCGPEELNSFLRNDLLETRYIGVLTSLLGLDGFLRWNYTVWPEDPRRDIRCGTFPAGDLNFVYPSRNGKPLLSLRYEQLRRGIGDFELLEQAKRRSLSAAVEAFYSRVARETDIRQFYPSDSYDLRPVGELCALDYESYAAAREELLAALDG